MSTLKFSFLSRRSALVASLATALLLSACSPALNWRDVRTEDTGLGFLMPCKPDAAKKILPMGAQIAELKLLSCNAGNATFAVASADIANQAATSAVLAQWQAAALANIHAEPSAVSSPFKLLGASSEPAAVLVKAQGKRPDGAPTSSQTVYFAQGSRVFQAVIYAEKITPEAAQTFFSSLKLE
jgi:hypothetical protein